MYDLLDEIDYNKPTLYYKQITDMQYFMQEIISQVYGDKEIDLEILDAALDELAFFIDMRVPKNTPSIRRADTNLCKDGLQ